MKAQIEALYRLQAQDQQSVALERRLAAIPKRLAEMDDDLAQLEQMLQSERGKLDESRSFKARQERQLEDEEEQIRTSKNRLGSIKNARELNATQRELESLRRMSQARSEELQNLIGAVTSAEERIEKMEQSLTELASQFEGERARLAEEREALVKQYEQRQGKRNALAAKVERPMLANYERIRRKVGGIVFVGVRERQCLACKIQVPHSIYVAMRKAEVIPSCDNCGRYQYWTGLFQKDEPADAESSSETVGVPAAATKPAPARRAPAPKKRVTRKSKKLEEMSGEPATDLAPKLAPEKVMRNPMALEDEQLPEESAPKPAPAPKSKAKANDEVEDSP